MQKIIKLVTNEYLPKELPHGGILMNDGEDIDFTNFAVEPEPCPECPECPSEGKEVYVTLPCNSLCGSEIWEQTEHSVVIDGSYDISNLLLNLILKSSKIYFGYSGDQNYDEYIPNALFVGTDYHVNGEIPFPCYVIYCNDLRVYRENAIFCIPESLAEQLVEDGINNFDSLEDAIDAINTDEYTCALNPFFLPG